MKKQTFDFNKMGVAPLSEFQMQEIEGGWPGWARWLAEQIVTNWEDIKQGAKDGWNSVHYN